MFERLSTKEVFLIFLSLVFTSLVWLLCSLVTKAESVLLPLYLGCLLAILLSSEIASSLICIRSLLWTLEARAESVLLPLYFCCFLGGPFLSAVDLKLAALPRFVTICCWICKLRWLEPRRPEYTAAACIWISALSWWIRIRLSFKRSGDSRCCSNPAFNSLN